MNIKRIITRSFCLFLIGCLATFCTKEEVQPTNTEGNVTGMDDWKKHNV